MKKILSIMMSAFMLVALAACGNTGGNNTTTKQETETSTPAKSSQTETSAAGGKNLVVYFSVTGNTKALAETIAETTGADIVEIVPETPYTNEDISYNNDNCRANKEQNDDSARPAIANKIENIDEYDTIYLGYPIWWGTMPKIINTFLETYDLSGKTVMPFCTSGGSSIEASVSAIKSICQNADVKDGFRDSSATASEEIKAWVEK